MDLQEHRAPRIRIVLVWKPLLHATLLNLRGVGEYHKEEGCEHRQHRELSARGYIDDAIYVANATSLDNDLSLDNAADDGCNTSGNDEIAVDDYKKSPRRTAG